MRFRRNIVVFSMVSSLVFSAPIVAALLRYSEWQNLIGSGGSTVLSPPNFLEEVGMNVIRWVDLVNNLLFGSYGPWVVSFQVILWLMVAISSLCSGWLIAVLFRHIGESVCRGPSVG